MTCETSDELLPNALPLSYYESVRKTLLSRRPGHASIGGMVITHWILTLSQSVVSELSEDYESIEEPAGESWWNILPWFCSSTGNNIR